jgi:hypothetical protein
VSPETYHWAVGMFLAGLVTGWLLMPRRRCRHLRQDPSIGETLEESLARLSVAHRPGVRMKGGQVLMGPSQPRPKVQDRIPAAPPRGGGGVTPGVKHIQFDRPPGMPSEGTTSGADQAYGGPLPPEHTVWR